MSRNESIQLGRRARVLICALALALLAPTLGIALQDRAVLKDFHNRALSTWPAWSVFAADPVAYFKGARAWLSERVFPVKQVTQLQKSLAFSLLASAPEPRITLGEQGHIFVNGGSNLDLNGLFEAVCVRAHSKRTAKALERGLFAWSQTARRQSLAVDVVIIPTPASLYADRLPRTAPAVYRTACLERTAGKSPLLSVRVPSGVRFVYPLREMLAARHDEAFFPRGNWHPTGLSLKLVRDTYLARLQVTTPVEELLELGQAPGEILLHYGIEKPEPTYFIRNHNVAAHPTRNAALRQAIADLFRSDGFVTHVFQNAKPIMTETALMISDSYGDWASETFAGAFNEVIQVNLNELGKAGPLQLIERVERWQHIDRLILLVEEGNARKLAAWNR